MEEAKGRLERAIQLARFGNRVKLGGKPEAWQPSQGHSWLALGDEDLKPVRDWIAGLG